MISGGGGGPHYLVSALPPPRAKFPVNLRKFYHESNIKQSAAACLCSEIGIYRDNLLRIIIYRYR